METAKKHPLDLLFKANEWVCFGKDAFETSSKIYKNIKSTDFVYFSINPLLERQSRRDRNVASFRNFLFEIDTLSLADQLRVLEASKISFATITYSGGKSYHAIVSLLNDIPTSLDTQSTIIQYKAYWQAMANIINQTAMDLGLASSGVVDSSCKNPSRFSRVPGSLRDGVEQSLVFVGRIMSDEELYNIINSQPKKEASMAQRRECQVNSTEDFFNFASKELQLALRSVFLWRASSGMYPYLFRFTLWAIDELDIPKSVWLSILEKKVFPRLVEVGYPSDRLTIAIDHAYSIKGGQS